MMLPRLWMTFQIHQRRIWLPLLLILPLVFVLEILAFPVLLILAIRKKEALFSRIAVGFYLSRLFLALIFYGRRFQIKVREDGQTVRIG